MSRLWWLLSLACLSLLVACGDPGGGNLDDDDDDDITPPDDDDDDVSDDDDAADDDDDDSQPPDVAEVDSVHPEDGTTDHYIAESLWVNFDIAAEDAEVSLWVLGEDDEPVSVEGTQLWLSETRLHFDPTDLLEAGVTYDAKVVWSEGAESHSWAFTTGDTGLIPVGSDITGNSYSMTVTDGTVVAPPGAEAFLGQVAATFLVGVVSQTESEIELIGSTAVEGTSPAEQNLCLPSFNLSEKAPTVWIDPYFAGGPVDVPQSFNIPSLGPIDLVFHDVEMSGVLDSSDGVVVDLITEGTFSAYVDMQEVGIDCSMLSGLMPGLSCSECPDQEGVEQCIVFDIIDIPGQLVEGLTLVERSQDDVDDDPSCD